MPSLIGSDIAANYRQQIVPFSRFGTRKVAWFRIGRADTNDGAKLDMETFNKIIDTIQTHAEIVMVGAPYVSDSWGKFMVAVFEDTMSNGANTDIDGLAQAGGPGFNGNATTIEQALRDATGDSNIQAERYWLFGAPATDTDDYYGFSNSPTYREYDTKAEWLANSYTQD